jgi:hypothetical protein
MRRKSAEEIGKAEQGEPRYYKVRSWGRDIHSMDRS